MAIKAVILDWDGTLIDSARNGIENLIRIVGKSGNEIPPNIRQRLKKHWGVHGGKLLEKSLGFNPSISRGIYKEWEKLDSNNKLNRLIPGVRKTLRKLRRERAINVCLLTSRGKQNFFKILAHYDDLITEFWTVQTSDDWSFVKPDPHSFCKLLHDLAGHGISKENCIYIGDTLVDFRAASKRGIENLSVLTGLFSKADFLKAGQKKENIIRSIADLPEWLNKYGRA